MIQIEDEQTCPYVEHATRNVNPNAQLTSVVLLLARDAHTDNVQNCEDLCMYPVHILDRPVAVHSGNKRGGVVSLHDDFVILRHVNEVIGKGRCPISVTESGGLEVARMWMRY